MRGTRDSPRLACKLRTSMMMGRVPLLAFRFFEKRPQQPTANPDQPRPPRLFPPFTRQLSTPRTAKMLFSVSRASVRRFPDEPGDGRPARSLTWCCPVLQQSGFSELAR